MADIKVSDLAAAPQALADADIPLLVQNVAGTLTTVKTTLADLKAYYETPWSQDIDAGGFDLNDVALLGIGTATPAYPVHVVEGVSGVTANAVADAFVIGSDSATGLTVATPTIGYFAFGDVAAPLAGGFKYDHTFTDLLSFRAANAWMATLNAVGLKVGVAVADGASATIHSHQAGVAAAIPCLELEQDDTDETFINFVGTSAASAAASISSWTAGSTIQGHIKIDVNGSAFWVRYYDAPTS